MPLLDIAISQPCSCFGNNILAFKSEARFHNKLVVRYDKGLGLASTFSWKTFCITKKESKNFNLGRAEVWRGGLMIKSVATLEISCVKGKRGGVKEYQNVLRMDFDSVRPNSSDFELQSSSEDPTEVGEREKLRRMRISKANKGNTPWNKGKKHSPETLQRIKERTRLAMQDPKVKMKLVNLGHAQSEETRMKIGVGVRLGWERRREKLMLQETCHYEWQNLIAVAARKGLLGEEELQWDSYKILSKEIEQEWLQSVEQRKNKPRSKGSKRAPKSAEQKRKISEAIAAKWADPEYRNRVCSGLAKFHGIAEGAERKPRRKPSADGQTRKRSPRKKDENNDPAKRDTKTQVQQIRSKRSRTPSYKDPLAGTKLEMLKNIRAQRTAAMTKKSEAIARAKMLITEAERAAEALEIAAKKSPLAQAALMESRMLIAEAIQLIESIEIEDRISSDNEEHSTEPASRLEEEKDSDTQNLEVIKHRKVNGVHSSSAPPIETDDFSFNKFVLNGKNGNSSSSCSNNILKTEEKLHQTNPHGFVSLDLQSTVKHSNFTKNLDDHKQNLNGISEQKPAVNGVESHTENAQVPEKKVNITKKWVRGRLVEVVEEA